MNNQFLSTITIYNCTKFRIENMVKFIMNQQQCECVDIEEERQGMKNTKIAESLCSEYHIQIFLLSNKFNKSHYAEASINPKGPG